MLEYISVKEVSAKWGISERRIKKLCEGNRIEGVTHFGHSWMVPRNIANPEDLRFKNRTER